MGNRYKIPFEIGTWGGVAAFAYFMLIWFTPWSPLGLARLGGVWIPVLFIFMAVRRQKDAQTEEGFTFGQALMTGMVSVMILGAVKAVLVFMVLNYVDLTLVERTMQENIAIMERLYNFMPILVNEQAINSLKAVEEIPTAYEVSSAQVSIYFMFGIPVSLLAALIYNRRPQNAS